MSRKLINRDDLVVSFLTGAVFIGGTVLEIPPIEVVMMSFIPPIAYATWAGLRKNKPAEVTSETSGCPNCNAGVSHFIGGPSYGAGVNVLCRECQHEFNIAPQIWPKFLLIDELGVPGPGRLADVYGIRPYEPVPKGKFRFEVDGRPAAPIRDTLSEAHDDAVRNGYAVHTRDGIRLDEQGEINHGK